ncbi:MAG TPA: hypothetical protein VFV38_00935 [Ktedonobacteraceae bacterium]|nr:hypothetical protein [Ktedonobacteraceae bacterium]
MTGTSLKTYTVLYAPGLTNLGPCGPPGGSTWDIAVLPGVRAVA